MGYLSLWPDAEGQSVVSTLNATDGAITSNMAIVPTLNGDIDAYAYNSTNLFMDIFSYFAPILPLNIVTTSLPAGTVNYGYSAPLQAAGGVLPYTWSLNGTLPPGLNLDTNSGLISGTPTMPGNDYTFNVQVTDSESPAQAAVRQLSITVNSTLSQLTITTTTLPNGSQNSPYNANLAASGGVTPYTWSISSGTLPTGLTLNSSTGAITGTPRGAGVSNFTVKVTDSESPAQNATQPLSITINPAVPLSISTTTLPDGTAGSPYSAPITAIGGVYPYTWSVTSGKIPDGLTLNSSTGILAGTPQNVGVSNFTVQVVDSETPPVTASAQLTLTINSPGGAGNLGLLSGNYAFYMNGFDSSGAWTLAGSFVSDGKGNITSGQIDINSITGQPYTLSITGTYYISAAGLNTITIQGQTWGPMTIAFVLTQGGDGRIIEYDDTTGNGSRGSGELRKANPNAFSLNALNGGWVFGMAGAALHSSNQVQRFVNVGQFALANGNITNGTCDTNDGGNFQTCTFAGSMSAVGPQTGRAAVTTNSNNGTTHNAVYVISIGDALIEQMDSVPSTRTPLQVGVMNVQTGPFNTGSMNGTDLMIMQAIHGSDGLDQSVAGIVSLDGHGNYTIPTMDEDLAGTITQKPLQQGTYTVQSNGALTFYCQSGGCPVGFLFSQNKGMLVSTGSSTMFGQFGTQSGGPFSNASISGNYVGGSMTPLDYANASNELLVGPADGNGTLTVSNVSSGSGGLDQSFGQLVNYSIAANGRGTAQGQGDPAPAIVYVISPKAFFVLMPKPDARLDILQH